MTVMTVVIVTETPRLVVTGHVLLIVVIMIGMMINVTMTGERHDLLHPGGILMIGERMTIGVKAEGTIGVIQTSVETETEAGTVVVVATAKIRQLRLNALRWISSLTTLRREPHYLLFSSMSGAWPLIRISGLVHIGVSLRGQPLYSWFRQNLVALFLFQWRSGRGHLPCMFFGRKECWSHNGSVHSQDPSSRRFHVSAQGLKTVAGANVLRFPA